jgi:1-acyl-sn-glycerol-3-phosphate acyltransferase
MAYWALKIVMTPILRIMFRVHSDGTSYVPRQGAAILASNHQSFIDSIFLPLVVPRRVTFVAKAEYFASWKTAWFFRALGMIPLKRDGGSASERALAAASEVLKGGGVLGIYPEGTRSPDGRLYRGHTGVARLSINCGAPVIPVAQFGTAAVQPIGRMWPKPFRAVRVKMGPPLRWDGNRAQDAEAAGGDQRCFTDQIMEAIQQLSGQDHVNVYARRDKGRLSAPGSEAEPVPATT